MTSSIAALRRGLADLGDAGRALLPELDQIERELELRALRVATLASAGRLASVLADAPPERTVEGVLMTALALTGAERAALIAPAAPADPDVAADPDGELAAAGFAVAARRGGGGALRPPARLVREALAGRAALDAASLRERRPEGELLRDLRAAVAAPVRLPGRGREALLVDRRLAAGGLGANELALLADFAEASSAALARARRSAP